MREEDDYQYRVRTPKGGELALARSSGLGLTALELQGSDPNAKLTSIGPVQKTSLRSGSITLVSTTTGSELDERDGALYLFKIPAIIYS